MRRAVLLTAAAVQDLDDLVGYVAEHDGPEQGQRVLARLEQTVSALSDHPDRGTVVPELAALGIRVYRQVFFKPYRIVYRALPKQVLVLLISDGRRDLRTLLQRRLLGPPEA